jgi:hypothetical protein
LAEKTSGTSSASFATCSEGSCAWTFQK